MSFYLDQLNSQQRAAVEYIDGPELVIAGAGSGKTRVLTYKIVHLLANGYEPWRIMALTFTNKAAREMRQRITALSGERVASRLWMGTFHSIFARILRSNADRIGFTSNFTIYDSADSRNLIKTIIRDMDLDEKVYKPSTVQNAISMAKNALMSAEQYAHDPDIARADRAARRPRTAEIFRAYVNRCRVAGAMDFDDLLYYTNVLLRDNDDLRRHYQEFFRYILVDEYQDTNFAQHAIVTLLTGDGQRVCVVGDDAQSIYSFRGANIRNILGLKKSFPNLALYKLEQNYRSTENIINAAGTLIAKNTEQIPKQVFSVNGAGNRVEVVRSFSDYEESYLVANRISQVKRATGDSYEEFAVLYRTNAQSRLLEESLRKRNIPYRIYGGVSFYQRAEVKDAIAYLRLSINPDDDEALRRVINKPARGIGETTVGRLTAAAIAHGVSMWAVVQNPGLYNLPFNAGTLRKLGGFADIVRVLGGIAAEGRPATEVVRAMYLNTGLMNLYRSDNTPENISKLQNLQELLNDAEQFVADRVEQGQADRTGMAEFMTELSLRTDADTADADGPGDKVTLMTIHAAKGLEFANVFVVGVEEDLLPSAMSQDTLAEVEEERRLLYVAITRAKRFCMLSYASSRYRNGMTVSTRASRFLADIDSRYLKLVSGTTIDGGRGSAGVGISSRGVASSPYTAAKVRQAGGGGLGYPAAPPQRRDQAALRAAERVAAAQASANAAAARTAAEGAAAGGDFSLHYADELATGMTVLHPRFGRGVITAVDAANPGGPRIQVNFNNSDIKTLLLKFAKFALQD